MCELTDDMDDRARQQARQQEQARVLYQEVLDLAPADAVDWLMQAILAAWSPQIVALARRKAAGVYAFIDLVQELETSLDDHTQRINATAFALDACEP